jgi:hypothetical protein
LDQRQLAILCVFGTAAWVIWLIFSVVRQYLLTRSQAEAQDRLLSRVGSPESLQVFLASESGREFLHRLEPDPNDAWRAIIRSAQTATIFMILGIGVLLCHLVYRDVQGLLPFSLGALILTAAFGASAVVSLVLHRHSGLLPSERE